MISHILVPLDGSELGEAVLPYAKDLGRRLNAKVRFLQVSEGEMPDLWDARSDARAAVEAAAKLTEREEKVADNYLSDLVSSWRAEGIDAECTVVEGAPAVKIIETAHSLGVDLIAMSTHGRSGFGRLISGSVADEVVREAGIPVLLVKPPDNASETIDATAASSAVETGAQSIGSSVSLSP
jgi:nucleotide-binding universal stress UspA family protein